MRIKKMSEKAIRNRNKKLSSTPKENKLSFHSDLNLGRRMVENMQMKIKDTKVLVLSYLRFG